MLNITSPDLGVNPRDWIEGAAKSLAVLESFSAERQRLNVTQIAERAGLTRAAARRHALTLRELGYLEEGEGAERGIYWLTHRVLRLAGNYLASARLPRVVQPTLNRLAAQTGHAFSVAVLDGSEAVIIARSGEHRVSGQVMPYGVHLGARVAAFATSTGRVLLAGMPEREFKRWLKAQQLPRLTPHTTTDKRQLAAIIQRAAQQGHTEAHEEHELGVFALAVPLQDAKGRTIAAMNLVYSQAREVPLKTTDALSKRYLKLMQDAAAELRVLL
jgi:IclR family transcriptional regulator, pca regulon regulatory protein